MEILATAGLVVIIGVACVMVAVLDDQDDTLTIEQPFRRKSTRIIDTAGRAPTIDFSSRLPRRDQQARLDRIRAAEGADFPDGVA